jgi:hypothetical protein
MLAITSALDDFVFSPLIVHFKNELESSRVIDKRMGSDVREEI